MRMRYKPYARPELAAWPYAVDAPANHRACWRNAFFDPQKPLRLELGCGKGGFLAQQALFEPQFNYLGVDIKSEMLVVAKRTLEAAYQEAGQPLHNVLIASWNIEKIADILAPEDIINRIYINFCNPWPSIKKAKHRLTHPRQLAHYRTFLADGGEIYFKTDDDRLFADSLRYFAYTGFAVTWQTTDLHAQEPAWNLRTEHEKMFATEGISIKACIAKKQPAIISVEEISNLRFL